MTVSFMNPRNTEFSIEILVCLSSFGVCSHFSTLESLNLK